MQVCGVWLCHTNGGVRCIVVYDGVSQVYVGVRCMEVYDGVRCVVVSGV